MTLGIPLPLYYWRRPFKVNAHVYTHCPIFFKEWAGVDYKQPRMANRMRHAQRHTKGLCSWCWYFHQMEVRYNEMQREAAE